jgi:ketosteroid isomerase-like protein
MVQAACIERPTVGVLRFVEQKRGSMSAEIEILKQFFAAINRNDMEGITKDFDPQIVRVEPAGFPTSGTYRGIKQVREQVDKGRGTWAEGTCDPERFLEKGDKVVVYLHAWVRLKGATEWTGGRFADGFAFRDGKITEYLTFWERQDALSWAGIEDPDESLEPKG